jgi:hypothetical protein
MSVIHNAHCFNDSGNKEKTCCKKKLTDSSVSSPATSVSQIQSCQQLTELAAIELDALVTFCGHWQLENADLKSLVPNAKTVHIPE